jgi:hypothetical protein
MLSSPQPISAWRKGRAPTNCKSTRAFSPAGIALEEAVNPMAVDNNRTAPDAAFNLPKSIAGAAGDDEIDHHVDSLGASITAVGYN